MDPDPRSWKCPSGDPPQSLPALALGCPTAKGAFIYGPRCHPEWHAGHFHQFFSKGPMAIVKDLDQHYIDTQLICPPGKARTEFVDPQRSGLYIEVRAASPGQGTYYLRYKDGSGKTCHVKLGKTSNMSLLEARAAAITQKAKLASQPIAPGAPVAALNPVAPPTAAAPGVMTVDTFVTEHYQPYAKMHKRSWKRDEQLYQRIKPRFGHLPLTGITKYAAQQMQAALMAEGLAKATVNHHVQLLRRLCNLAVQWDMLEKNPLVGVQMLFVDNQRDTYLNDEQVERLVQTLRTHSNRTVAMIVMFLLSTGARLREGMGAEWKDIDQVAKMWRIPATNSKSKRMKQLPLNDNALWVLGQLESKEKSPYVFPSPVTGKPYTFITYAWRTIKKRAGIPDNMRLHDLRHTFATRLACAGRSMFELQMLLGHADPRMTQRYAHLSPQRARDASNAGLFAIA